ncbi:MAG: hypothetical protein JSR48_07480 [Verrucomicrobia bacterium]|nr:hypothetical protein [Verrucomicrobiota bacterium]
MMPSTTTPKLPKWIFFLTDAILLLTAWYIASRSTGPLSATAILSITALVITGAIVGTIPLLLHYEREKNEALDDRQRALEALASTLTTAAEQIGIAAQGLNSIADLTQKTLKVAEQLPQRLQEKVAAIQAGIDAGRDEEREELKKELIALRAVESEQLSATATKVQQAAAELAKAEAAAQKSLAAATKAPEVLAAAAAAQVAALDAKVAESSKAALADLENRLAAHAAAVKSALNEAEARWSQLAREGAIAVAVGSAGKPVEVGTPILPIVPPTMAPFTGNIISVPAEDDITIPPMPDALVAKAPETAEPAPAPTPTGRAEIVADDTPLPEEPKSTTRDTADPFRATAEEAPAPAATEEPKPKKPRAPRKPKPVEPTPALELGMAEPAPAAPPADEFSQVAPGEPAEKAISADGATRLLVTAYIGIGNRLFIRGEGPGLTWDKGVPLQFVSIGKWRWESAEATGPVKYKLYKNDETECTALGAQSLDSGHQQEVTATF